ncbi:hypothetical protein EB001_11020 [bacterium]|nr:hypothetical protein [bacterium]
MRNLKENKNTLTSLMVLLTFILAILTFYPDKALAIIYGGDLISEETYNNKVCCSNVIFIPGFESSRLYADKKGIFGTTTDKLWEPLTSSDIKRLSTDSNGNSVTNGVYTKDIIDSIPLSGNIYESFIKTMDGLVSDGTIKRWISTPYDWRKGVYDIVDDGFVDKVIDLSKDSKTGKVIIIAHSNGGLITKALMKKLKDIDKTNLIENVILVTVPELGTPKAISSMLHGYQESLAKGVIMNSNEAREFSKNLPGAYGLLPSKKFFENNPVSIITNLFSASTTINSFEGLKNFLFNNPFSRAFSSNTDIPILLNQKLFSKNEELHSQIDDLKMQNDTKVTSISGWGLETIAGLFYKKDKKHCKGNNTYSCDINFRVSKNKSGDGTVLTKSNSGNNSILEYFNLDSLNKDKNKKINHANVLESTDLLNKITDTIKDQKPENPSYGKYFSTTEPIDDSDDLRIDIYSPLDIDIYDKQGRHVGLVYNAYYNRYLDDDEYTIPGSFYAETGSTKTVSVPFGQEYKIMMRGNDVGVFVVDLSREKAGENTITTSFSELVATPLTNIELVVGTSSETFLKDSYMNIDFDGDQMTDIVSRSDEYRGSTTTWPIRDIQSYLESMRKVIVTLGLSSKVEKSWLNRIDTISNIDQIRNRPRVERIIKRLSRKDEYHNDKITDKQKTAILNLFEELLPYVESTARGKKG